MKPNILAKILFEFLIMLMQPLWNAINNYDPQVFIWMGDNIYGDIRRPFKLFGKERTIGPWKNVPRFVPSSHHEMQSKYNLAKHNPHYSILRRKAKVSASRTFLLHFYSNGLVIICFTPTHILHYSNFFQGVRSSTINISGVKLLLLSNLIMHES